MRAILVFELRLLCGRAPVAFLALLAVAILALVFLLGRAAHDTVQATTWLGPLALLFLLWREREAKHRLDTLVGSIPLGPADLLGSHLLFWSLVALVPAAALGLLEHGGHGAGLPPPFTLFTLRMWLWFCWGFGFVGVLTSGLEPDRVNAYHGAAVALAVFIMVMEQRVPTVALAVVTAACFAWLLRSRTSIEYVPSLTPKRVLVGKTSTPSRHSVVRWRWRRDREGVRQARQREAHSPRRTLLHLLGPIGFVPWIGLYAAIFFMPGAKKGGLTAGMGLVVLLALLHVYLYLALPRWHFLRQTPIAGRRILLWFFVPLLLALVVPGALLWRLAEATEFWSDFSTRSPTWDCPRGRQIPYLVVPRVMQEMLEESEDLPPELPTVTGGLLPLREWPQTRIQDEAAYFEQVVAFFLRTRYHVDPKPGELRKLLGPPQSTEQIAALALWGAIRDGPGEWLVEGEIPIDIWHHLLEETGPLPRRARGNHLPATETRQDRADQLAFEMRVAEVLAKLKQDGAVYDFGQGLSRLRPAFEGRVRAARARRNAIDLVAFLILLIASLRWALRDPVSRWLAPLTAAGLILAWSWFAWWPIGTAVYLWSMKHFWVALACGVALVALLLVAFVRSLRTMDASAAESL